MYEQLVKIYAEKRVPRLTYTAGLFIGDILGLPWEIVTDRRKLGKHPVINYSSEKIEGSFNINPDPLLFEDGIKQRDINISEWNGLPVFFQTESGSDIPFDIFAAVFYMVSRYEEYLDFEPDEYGRFRASSSLAWKNGFLDKPVVDLWAKEFAKALLRKIPTLAFKGNEYKALLTIDTDQPFAFLGKSLFRNVGGFIKDLTVRNAHAGDRYKVVTHEVKDPYEVFDYMIQQADLAETDVKFFFPTGNHSDYDRNPSWKNEEYRDLINRIAGKYDSGLHPSFYAANNYSLLEEEYSRLKNIMAIDISSSRFHYLRLFTPTSYRNLLKAGIKEDYSMGFHDEPGFRAGIARPYLFYDVATDMKTDLTIVPFQVMDATLFSYKNLDPVESKKMVFALIDRTKKAGGLFVSLWHNTSLLETPEWKGWRELFETMLQYQRP
jgi:hypothetical protein